MDDITDGPLDLADALTHAAESINRANTLEETLDAIVHATRSSVPGFTDVGISIIHRDGGIETVAGAGQLVWELDSIQYDLGEGCCVESVRMGKTVMVERAGRDSRWPRYLPQAVHQGIRSQLALHLYDDGETIGGLNLYSTASEEIAPDAAHAAELFATHASIALGHARQTQQLSEALNSRKTVGQAIGILMERYQIDQDRAFEFLVRASSTSNIKLREVAEELVITTDERLRH